jgi:hypothetical protein
MKYGEDHISTIFILIKKILYDKQLSFFFKEVLYDLDLIQMNAKMADIDE